MLAPLTAVFEKPTSMAAAASAANSQTEMCQRVIVFMRRPMLCAAYLSRQDRLARWPLAQGPLARSGPLPAGPDCARAGCPEGHNASSPPLVAHGGPPPRSLGRSLGTFADVDGGASHGRLPRAHPHRYPGRHHRTRVATGAAAVRRAPGSWLRRAHRPIRVRGRRPERARRGGVRPRPHGPREVGGRAGADRGLRGRGDRRPRGGAAGPRRAPRACPSC